MMFNASWTKEVPESNLAKGSETICPMLCELIIWKLPSIFTKFLWKKQLQFCL